MPSSSMGDASVDLDNFSVFVLDDLDMTGGAHCRIFRPGPESERRLNGAQGSLVLEVLSCSF